MYKTILRTSTSRIRTLPINTNKWQSTSETPESSAILGSKKLYYEWIVKGANTWGIRLIVWIPDLLNEIIGFISTTTPMNTSHFRSSVPKIRTIVITLIKRTTIFQCNRIIINHIDRTFIANVRSWNKWRNFPNIITTRICSHTNEPIIIIESSLNRLLESCTVIQILDHQAQWYNLFSDSIRRVV